MVESFIKRNLIIFVLIYRIKIYCFSVSEHISKHCHTLKHIYAENEGIGKNICKMYFTYRLCFLVHSIVMFTSSCGWGNRGYSLPFPPLFLNKATGITFPTDKGNWDN